MKMGAAAALGAMLAFLLAFAATPVLASVMAILLGLISAYFGLKTVTADGADAVEPTRRFERLGAGAVLCFALAFVVFLPLSLYAKSHRWLSPTPQALAHQWQRAGLSKADASRIALYELNGFYPEGTSADTVADRADRVADVGLFAEDMEEDCAALEPEFFTSPDRRLRAMQVRGEPWNRLSTLPADSDPGAVADAAFALLCGD